MNCGSSSIISCCRVATRSSYFAQSEIQIMMVAMYCGGTPVWMSVPRRTSMRAQESPQMSLIRGAWRLL